MWWRSDTHAAYFIIVIRGKRWLDREEKSNGICTVNSLRTLPEKTISAALAESLQLLNFTTYSAQPSFIHSS